MARINTYGVFRKIHLYAMMILGVFLLVYFVSGLFFRHYHLPNNAKTLPTDTLQINMNRDMEDQEMFAFLEDSLELSVKLGHNINYEEDGSMRMFMMGATKRYWVTIPSDKNQVYLQKHINDTRESVHFYHVVHRYGGGFKYDLYLVFLDLVSISMLVFAVSGIYMWYNLMRNKWWGIISLVLGLVYVTAVIVTFS
tara:strand:+ start:348 stop:935 length:588 start_codon:yes stop_codon:yes gene_type:complete